MLKLLGAALAEEFTIGQYLAREQFRQNQTQLLQVEFQFFTDCNDNGPVNSSNKTFYQTYLPTTDILSTNSVNDNKLSMANMIKAVYFDANLKEKFLCVRYSQLRLLHPFTARVDKVNNTVSLGTNTSTKASLAATSEWVNIFTYDSTQGNLYELPYATFIIEQKQGQFNFSSFETNASSFRPCSTLGPNCTLIVPTTLVKLDTRTTCAQGFTKTTACIDQAYKTKHVGMFLDTIDNLKTNDKYLEKIRDPAFYFAWTGTDADGKYYRSERGVFSHFQQFIIPQKFYDSITDWAITWSNWGK